MQAGQSSIRPPSDPCLVLMEQGFQYSYQIWIKAWTCQALLYLNIEQPSIISFLVLLLRWKVKEWKGQVWSSVLKVLISASLWKSNALLLSSGAPSLIFLFLSHWCPAFSCVMGKTAPILMVTNFTFVPKRQMEDAEDFCCASTRQSERG